MIGNIRVALWVNYDGLVRRVLAPHEGKHFFPEYGCFLRATKKKDAIAAAYRQLVDEKKVIDRKLAKVLKLREGK